MNEQDERDAAVIAVEHVTKRFGEVVAVDDADFEIAPGEFFALLGPSGCGKTTTLRMIAGFETPSEGAIRLGGTDVSRVPPHNRNVNTVFQQYALFPHMNVWDNVAYGPRSQKIPRAETARRVDDLLEIVKLKELARRRPSQLSGGQQQRVALARALVNYPSALLLDEPLGALDLKLRQTMQLELKRIQREVGIAFVFVTHDQEEALTMSDRIAVMNDGRVQQIGTPQDIYHEPTNAFVAGFIGSANLLSVNIADGVVELPGGRRARAGVSEGAPDSGSALLMVRPERVRVGMEAPEANVAAIDCVVVDVVFQGPVIRFALDAHGDVLVAHVRDAEGLPMVRPGDRLWASWGEQDARVLARSKPRAEGSSGGTKATEPMALAAEGGP